MGWLDFIEGLVEDISEIPGDVKNHFEKLVEGPGGVVGIMVAGGVIFVGAPGHITTAVVAGFVAGEITEAMVKTRRMSPEERTLAQMVFGNSLPSLDKIILSNIEGKDGRLFVVPNLVGESIINLGSAFDDPIRHTKGNYREFGQVFVHELTHVWQIENSDSPFGFLCEAIHTQLSGGPYEPSDGMKSWEEYNPEQQATMVDRWYAGAEREEPCSTRARFYNHVQDTINGGNKPPVVQTLSVRDVAKSKFNENGNFSVKSRFPINRSGSLRKSLIGLKG